MSETARVIFGILLPFFGTALGAGTVFSIRKKPEQKLQNALLGLASGVMIAASVWSLLIPSIEMAEQAGTPPWIPAVFGFLAGMGFLLLLDILIPGEKIEASYPNGSNNSFMLILAVTLHNIPEGMAVGVAFAGALNKSSAITLAGAMALSMGIAIQNFPEGAIISMPLAGGITSKSKAFACGALSGIVEPIGAVLTLLVSRFISVILPYVLAFAAGAMIYVVVQDLIPQFQKEKEYSGTVGVALGFSVMMLLDVALG